MSNLPLFFVLIILALQLVVIAMLQHVYANKNVKAMGDLLHAQNERIALEAHAQNERIGGEVHTAIERGTEAAHTAYKEANSVNVKISDLNERLLEEQQKDAT